jgi:hypothetical protein
VNITYTAISPGNDVIVLTCASLDHALALAMIDLHRGYTPMLIRSGRRRLDIEAILRAIDVRRRALRQSEARAD